MPTAAPRRALLLLAFLVACAPPPELSDGDRRDVAAALEEFRQAWLRNDEAAVMAHMSPEFRLVMPGGRALIADTADLRAYWFPDSGPTYRITRYEVTGATIHGGGRYAFAEGRSLLGWQTIVGDSVLDSTGSTSDFVTVLRKEDRHWRLFRQIFVLR